MKELEKPAKGDVKAEKKYAATLRKQRREQRREQRDKRGSNETDLGIISKAILGKHYGKQK